MRTRMRGLRGVPVTNLHVHKMGEARSAWREQFA
jgi:hypothetical protein